MLYVYCRRKLIFRRLKVTNVLPFLYVICNTIYNQLLFRTRTPHFYKIASSLVFIKYYINKNAKNLVTWNIRFNKLQMKPLAWLARLSFYKIALLPIEAMFSFGIISVIMSTPLLFSRLSFLWVHAEVRTQGVWRNCGECKFIMLLMYGDETGLSYKNVFYFQFLCKIFMIVVFFSSLLCLSFP